MWLFYINNFNIIWTGQNVAMGEAANDSKQIHKYHSQWDEESVAGPQSYLHEVGITVNINPIVYGSAIKSRQH